MERVERIEHVEVTPYVTGAALLPRGGLLGHVTCATPSLQGLRYCRGMAYSVTGGDNMTLHEVRVVGEALAQVTARNGS